MWWIAAIAALTGAWAGSYVACDVVFGRFAFDVLYPGNLERAIRAVNLCRADGAFGVGVISFVVGSLVGAATRKAPRPVTAIATFAGAVVTGALSGLWYYWRW